MKNNLSLSRVVKKLNENRAYLLIIIMLLVGLTAKNFFTHFNLTSVLNSTVLYALIGAGFTLCMVAGHMDLSVGAVANMASVIVMGMHTNSKLPWALSILISLCLGTLVGVINGLLVSKAKIHSFITTLGMQFVLKGAMYIYCKGNEIGDKGDYGLADILNKATPVLPLTPKVMITIALVLALAALMWATRWGRNIYLLGGNEETAWLAGINSDKTNISVFAMSGFFCAVGGVIFAICQSSASPNMGEKGIPPLLVALTATIIGGTSTYGGRGSVWKTFMSVLGLMIMNSVLTSKFGKFEVQILAMGLVLAACVLYETISDYFANKKIGVRGILLEELGKG